MTSGKAQAATAPTALGSLLQAATYGQTIPTVYGMTMSPLLAIWAANLRQGGSVKKFKQLKKGITAYVENIDFLIGHNPIMGVQQMWNNGAAIPLNFTVQSYSGEQFGPTSFVISTPSSSPNPDPLFYAVIGVTMIQNYNVTFDDYGGNGPVTFTGTYEVPLWNELQTGPDPTDPNSYRNYPFVYRWQPSYGAEIFIDGFKCGANPVPFNPQNPTIKVYYTQLMEATSFMPPIQKMRLAFEPELGSGTEYADADLSSQQIIYPMFAGLGSSDIDLGSGGAIPQLQAEVQGKFGLYSTGDADFADMIEDVFKSGVAQAAIGAETATTRVEHGLSGYSFPGAIQKKVVMGFNGSGGNTVTFNMPNTAGNILVALVDVGPGTSVITPSVATDSLGNTWIQSDSASRLQPGTSSNFTWTLLYVQNCAEGNNTITFTNVTGAGFGQGFIVMELSGVDTFDGVIASAGTTANCSLTTTAQQGFAEVILAFSGQQTVFPYPGQTALWPVTVEPFVGGDHDVNQFVQQRNVSTPGTYSLTFGPPSISPAAAGYMVMIAFKATVPANYPQPVGDFIDLDSLNQVRLQCRANGLWGSLSMNSQQAASDWLNTLYAAADAAPVFMGFKLFSIPYSEVSAVGNGAIYTSPTASGPVASLSDLNGDFVGSSVPIKVDTTARVDQPNVLQMQCINRSSNYNPSLVEQPDAASISLFGIRKQDPITNNAVQDVSVARMLLGIQVRTLQYGSDNYTFTVSAKWSLLAPMDLILVTDTLAAIFNEPVRITSMVEQADLSFECEATPFVYGMCAPTPFSTDQPTPFIPNPTISVGDVNPPIIFEPTPQLYGSANQGQIWIVVSSSDPNYGGCQVYISVDGGNSYNPIGDPLIGSATTGVTTADWPASTGVDYVNPLLLDLSESNGSLLNYSNSEQFNLVYPCYVEGGGQPIPYELMNYGVATLTGTNLYTLEAGTATPGGEAFLLRGIEGAPEQDVGVDHPSGSRFAFLSPNGQGILKINMDPQWVQAIDGRQPDHTYALGDEVLSQNNIPLVPDQVQKITTAGTTATMMDITFSGTFGGVTPDGTAVWTNQGYAPNALFFKVVSFNTFAAATQDLNDVPVYTYLPLGTSGSGVQVFQVNGS